MRKKLESRAAELAELFPGTRADREAAVMECLDLEFGPLVVKAVLQDVYGCGLGAGGIAP